MEARAEWEAHSRRPHAPSRSSCARSTVFQLRGGAGGCRKLRDGGMGGCRRQARIRGQVEQGHPCWLRECAGGWGGDGRGADSGRPEWQQCGKCRCPACKSSRHLHCITPARPCRAASRVFWRPAGMDNARCEGAAAERVEGGEVANHAEDANVRQQVLPVRSPDRLHVHCTPAHQRAAPAQEGGQGDDSAFAAAHHPLRDDGGYLRAWKFKRSVPWLR